MILDANITCPECGHVQTEIMPEHHCQCFYECKGCNTVLKAKQGDCCVYCSYADIPCPPVQIAGASCCGASE